MVDYLRRLLIDAVSEFEVDRQPRTGWRAPLVAVADAADPLFPSLKEIVRPTHALPEDLLAGARSVVAFFLPFDTSVPLTNREGRAASETWARAYVETNELIAAVSRHLAEGLRQRGYRSALMPATHNFDEATLMSDWSHKHVAYIAGLGTFGLHHMLITAAGCGGRLGTLVTDAVLPATPRPAHEACLHKHDGTCGLCVKRCVADALTMSGTDFDRQACHAVCLENETRYKHLGHAGVCGKCAAGMPCTITDPVAKLEAR